MELDVREQARPLVAGEALLRAFTEHSPAVMFVKDRQGCYRFVNPQFLQRFGMRREQVIGRTDAELFAPPYALALAANDAQVLSHGQPMQFEAALPAIGGESPALVVKFPALDGVGGMLFDITERKPAEQEPRESRTLPDEERLRAAAETLSRLSRRLVEAEEAERRRIARELHDRVGQNLSALNINLDIVLGMLGEQAPPEVRVRLRDSLALVDGTLQTIENVMADLRPPLLDEYGLGAALGWHAEDFVRRTRLRVDFEDRARERTRALRHDDAVTLFRIAQEVLNNVAKHAHAGQVKIGLSVVEDQFVLEIGDDGRGFDPGAPTSRLGMRSMRERAAAAGAALEVQSAPGEGTVIRVRIPLPR